MGLNQPLRIRGGSGLGDSIYLRPVVDHFIGKGHPVTACSSFPDVFINSGALIEPFGRDRIDVLAHYTSGKMSETTTQWEDVCRSARISEPLPLRFTWSVLNTALVNSLKSLAWGRPIVLVHGGRAPMARTDSFGAELLPTRQAFQAAIDQLSGCFLVQVGKDVPLYKLRVDHDALVGATSVSDLLDIGLVCDGVLAQCSFAVPLAEAFDKPLLAVWAASGLRAQHAYVRQITPRKVLSKATSHYVIDDEGDDAIKGKAREFLTQL